MLRALLNWTIALIFLVNTIFTFPVFALDTSINPSTKIEIQENIKQIEFSNSPNFYQQLIKLIQNHETFKITTSYNNISQFPENLKKILSINNNLVTSANIAATGYTNIATIGYISGLSNEINGIQGELNLDALYFIGYTALGAGIGTGIGVFFAGVGVVPGALTGGVIGFGGSLVAKAFQEHYIVELIFDITGKVIIIVRPA